MISFFKSKFSFTTLCVLIFLALLVLSIIFNKISIVNNWVRVLFVATLFSTVPFLFVALSKLTGNYQRASLAMVLLIFVSVFWMKHGAGKPDVTALRADYVKQLPCFWIQSMYGAEKQRMALIVQDLRGWVCFMPCFNMV